MIKSRRVNDNPTEITPDDLPCLVVLKRGVDVNDYDRVYIMRKAPHNQELGKLVIVESPIYPEDMGIPYEYPEELNKYAKFQGQLILENKNKE